MQAQSLNISCKNGTLRVQDGFLRIHGYTGRMLWQAPIRAVRSIEEVSRTITVTCIIHTALGDRTVEWIAPTQFLQLQQVLAISQVSAPPPERFPFTNPSPASTSAMHPPLTPPPPVQQRGSFRQWWQARQKRTKVGLLGCAGLLVLAFCLCIASVGAASGGRSTSSPTPPATIAPLAQVSTVVPAYAPTAKPTHAPVPTPTPLPKPVPTHALQPTQTSAPTPTTPTGVNGNPWGYDFNAGNLIYSPPADFCKYFNCIANFWSGTGFVNECHDATYSKSGGRSNDCSHHDGEWRPLYAH